MICFKKIFLDFFNFKRKFINDKYIKNYLFLIYPKLNNKYCKYLFCNKNFIINYQNCEKVLCQFKKNINKQLKFIKYINIRKLYKR